MQEITEKVIAYLFQEKYLQNFVQHDNIKFIVDDKHKKFISSVVKFYSTYDKVPLIDEYEKYIKEQKYHSEYSIMFQKYSAKRPAESYKFLIDQLKDNYIKDKFQNVITKVDYKNLDLQHVQAQIGQIINDTETTTDVKRGFVYENLKERYQFVKNGGVGTGISSGFSVFDRHTGGLNKKELYLFFGRAGIGKTRVLFNFAYNISHQYLWGMFFSLEMPLSQMFRIYDSRTGAIPSDDIKYGKVDLKAYKKVLLEIKEKQQPLEVIEHTGGASIDFIINEVKAFKKKNPLDFVVIDYLTLMKTGLDLQRDEEYGVIAKELKNLAKREDIIVITAAQANRKSTEQESAGLENIGYSDQIAHNADFVAYIQRGKIIDKVMDMKIIKNREGVSNVSVKFMVDFPTSTMKDVIEQKPKEKGGK